MKNLYIYPHASPIYHDDWPQFRNVVPLSKDGIDNYFNVVNNPEEADYFFMGQFRMADTGKKYLPEKDSFPFLFLKGNEEKHIVDYEGEGGTELPSWFNNLIVMTMGPLKKFSNFKHLFCRPTFSNLLLRFVNEGYKIKSIPSEKKFGFKGYINCNSRHCMVNALNISNLPYGIETNGNWAGLINNGHPLQEDYIKFLENHLLSLCPRGSGIDSVRFLETCCVGRVPIIISDKDYILPGEHLFDINSFCFKIISSSSIDVLKSLHDIFRTDINKLYDKAILARKYWDEVILKYFENPTKFFLDWLER